MADLFEPREQRLDIAARITRVARFASKPQSAPVFLLTVGAVAIIAHFLSLARLDAVSALSVVTFVSIFVGSLAAGLAGFAFSAVTGALLFQWLTPSAAVPL